MTDAFRIKLAEKAIEKPSFAKEGYQVHSELVRISGALREGVSLKEIALRAWTYQDMNVLPVHVGARLRTIYRRIIRHTNMEGV